MNEYAEFDPEELSTAIQDEINWQLNEWMWDQIKTMEGRE